MSRYSHESFFFSQKKRPVRVRVKKALDKRALSTTRRASVLKFRPQGVEIIDTFESSSLVNYKVRSKEGSVTSLGSGLDPSKFALHLPPLSPKGQLLTGPLQPLEEAEEDPVEHFGGVSKHKLLRDLAKAAQDRVITSYKFSEVKFASTSILANLGKVLEDVSCLEEISLPLNLADIFKQNYYYLVADTVVEQREWQTDCYLDLKPSQPFLTDDLEPDKEEEIKQNFERSLNVFAIRQSRERAKIVRMSKLKEDSKRKASENRERPSTSRSTTSVKSIESVDIDWDKESIASRLSRAETEYDKLPSHLRLTGTPLLRFRRETALPSSTLRGPGPMTLHGPGPMTRLEKFKAMVNRHDTSSRARPKFSMAKKPEVLDKDDQSMDQATEDIVAQTTRSNINFDLTSAKEKGWIILSSVLTDPESYTLHQWANSLLKENKRKRQEAQIMARLLGEDGKLVVRRYSDPQNRRRHWSRHQRAFTFPLPAAVLSKLPPGLSSGARALSSQEEELFTEEGLRIFVIVLPDSSGFCNYYSGRVAVSFCRKGDGSRGLYTIAYDDTDSGRMIGCFLPDGRGCCYYRSGAIRAIMDQCGGKLLDKEGNVTKRWTWPPNNERMPVTVVVELNQQVVFQCVGRTNMALRFSDNGKTYKLPLGLVPEVLEEKPDALGMRRSGVIFNTLQTHLKFQSKSAKALESGEEMPATKVMKSHTLSKPHSRAVGFKKQKSLPRVTCSAMSIESFMEPDSPPQPWDQQYYAKDLDSYKNRFKDIVDEWLDYYRRIMGISAPTRRHTPVPSATHSSAVSSHSLQSLSGTFSSSRQSVRSRSRSLTHSAMPLGGGTGWEAEEGAEEAYPSVKPVSPLKTYTDRPKSHGSHRKVGPAQVHSQPPRKIKKGCPQLLHEILLDKPPKVALCRCDKRRIPLLRDLELDEFLTSHVPGEQLVVVCITSSKDPLPCEPLLNSIHYSRNRSRFSPCQQSFEDSFRILLYDLDRALDGVKPAEPLLRERHHAAFGMFLMFMGGQLIGANTEFNGYGATKRDFLKQIQSSIEMGKKGRFLPRDFKLLPTKAGSKIHSRSLWAYPISGVLGDFISCTPSVSSQPSASLPSSFSSLYSGGSAHQPKMANQLS